jgi:DNA-binding MarR family transcriptional regulator
MTPSIARLSLVPGIHRATHRIGLWLDAAEPPLEVTHGEAHLLAHLFEAGSSSVAELHAAFAHKRSSLTTYLDRLEHGGHILRLPHPKDRRSFLISLTPKGSALSRRVHHRLLQLEASTLRGLGRGEVRALQSALVALQSATEGLPSMSSPKRGGTR